MSTASLPGSPDALAHEPIAPAAIGGSAARRRLVARWLDRGLLAALGLSGLLHPRSSLVWYACLAVAFVAIAGGLLLTAWSMDRIAARVGKRIQSTRRDPMSLQGALATVSSAWVAACLLAWPVAQARTGQPNGLVWSLADAHTTPWTVLLETALALVVLDAWLYWKHRLLHTRWLFAFHREHHGFRDPNTFSSFAVGPLEALLTFWPIVLLSIPQATHWAPLYFGTSAAFVLLNFYLHSGVTWRWVEAILPRAYVNTSAHHNIHHSHADTNFAEAFTIWDHLCGTRLDENGSPNKTRAAAARVIAAAE